MKSTPEISLQFKKLTNNATTSFIITFGLQGITDKTIHVHNTNPQCTDWSLTEHLNKLKRQDTGRNIFQCRHLLKML